MKNLVKNFSLLAVLATPVTSLAEEDLFDPFSLGDEEEEPEVIYYNYAKLKFGYVSQDNFQFGKYNDFSDDGAFVTGDLFYTATGTTNSWSVDINDLGLDAQSLSLIYRTAGNFGVRFDYSEAPAARNNTGISPFLGDEELVLPATWVAAVNTSDFDPGQFTRQITNDVLRKQLEVDVNKLFASGLRLGGSVNFEEKTGTMIKGMAIYSNAANPQAVLLPAPVDQDTLTVELRGGFSNDRLAVSTRLGYTDFSNDDLVTWQNPYASGLGVADYPTGIGGYAPAPDYEMLSLTGTLGYRIGNSMRFTLDGMTSETEQQEALQDYTTRPGTVTTPLPTEALVDGLKVNMLATSLRAKPTSRLSLKVSYRFNERENTFARNAWQYVRGDGAEQPGPEFAVFNRPLHIQKDTYTAEGKYRFKNRTSLSLIYDFEETQRDLAAVTETEEDTVTIKVNLPRTEQLGQHFEMSVSNLAGSTYEWSQSFFQQQAVALINQIPDDQRWTNHPLLRQYHLANQEKISAKWSTSWFPNEAWMLQGNLSSYLVNFDKSELGLTDVLTSNLNLNLHYTGSEAYSSWVWIDYTADERTQWGRDFRGGLQKPANQIFPPLAQGSDPTRNYEVEQGGDSISVGFGTKWQVSDRWSLDMSYAYLWAEETYEVRALGARDLAGTDLPDTRYEMHNLTTSLGYELQNGLLLSLEHQYFRYTDSSWQYDDLTIGDINKLLGTSQLNPNEAVNMLLLGVSYRF